MTKRSIIMTTSTQNLKVTSTQRTDENDPMTTLRKTPTEILATSVAVTNITPTDARNGKVT
jgi:hypothetical protein